MASYGYLCLHQPSWKADGCAQVQGWCEMLGTWLWFDLFQSDEWPWNIHRFYGGFGGFIDVYSWEHHLWTWGIFMYFPASHQHEKTRLGALNLESEAIWGATFSEDICGDLLSFLCFLVVLVATMNPYESHRFLSFISVLEPLTARSLRLFFATTEDFADVVDDIKDSLESSKDQSLKELALNGFPKISSRVKERPWRKKPVLQVQIVYPPVF